MSNKDIFNLIVDLIWWLEVEASRQVVQLSRQAGQAGPVVRACRARAHKIVLLQAGMPLLKRTR